MLNAFNNSNRCCEDTQNLWRDNLPATIYLVDKIAYINRKTTKATVIALGLGKSVERHK